MNDEQLKTVREMAERGESPQAIADHFGITRSTLNLRLAKAGYELNLNAPSWTMDRTHAAEKADAAAEVSAR